MSRRVRYVPERALMKKGWGGNAGWKRKVFRSGKCLESNESRGSIGK